MRPLRLSRSLALALALMPACGARPATTLVLAVSAEPRAPEEIDQLQVRVTRAGSNGYDRTYSLPGEAALPGTLVLSNDQDEPGNPVVVTVQVRRHEATAWKIVRQARVGFVAEKSKLLRLPLKYVCANKVCADGQTCIDGVCASFDVDPAKLPEAGDPAAPLACFDVDRCLAGAVVATSCEISLPSGDYNLGAVWVDGSTIALDPTVDFTTNGAKAALSAPLCAAVTDGRITAVLVSTACPTKDPVTTPCARQSSGAGGQGGAGGSAGSVGTAGAGQAGAAGTAGGAGTGGGGQAGTGGGGAGQSGAGQAGAGQAGMAGQAGAGQAGAGQAGAGQAGAGQAGAGQAGAGGIGGTAGSAGACTISVVAPDTTVDVDQPFALDASLSASTPGGPLVFAWTPTGAAFPLTNGDGPTPTGKASGCGKFTYDLQVSSPSCGAKPVTQSVSLSVRSNGQHVSASTCVVGEECGTVSRPFCTVAAAIAAETPTGIYKLAPGSYFSNLVVTVSPVKLEGGYESTFTVARNTDPSTNGVELVVSGQDGIRIDPKVAFGLDAVTVRVAPGVAGIERRGITITDDAKVSLTKVRLIDSLTLGAPTSAGVVLGGPLGGGSLTMNGVQLYAPTSTGSGVALRVSAKSDVTSTNGAFIGQTAGVDATGAGKLSFSGDTLAAQSKGALGVAAGLDVLGATSVTLKNVSATAKGAIKATGAELSSPGIVEITGGTYSADATAANGTATGIHSDDASMFTLEGSDVRGSTASSGSSSSSVGVELTTSTAGAFATIVGATIEGGGNGHERYGVRSFDVGVSISASTVRGSTKPGGVRAVGVELRGAIAPSSLVDNVELTGGAPAADGTMTGEQYAAFGVDALQASGTLTMTANTLVAGCTAPCSSLGNTDSLAAGVALEGPAALQIDGPGLLLGGPCLGGAAQHAGIFVASSATSLNPVTLSAGLLLQGNVDAGALPAVALGLSSAGRPLQATNVTFEGREGDTAIGADLRSTNAAGWPVVTLSGCRFHGGEPKRATALTINHVDLTMTNSFLDACGISGGCASASADAYRGFVANDCRTGSVTNNFIFAGPASTDVVACELGNDGSATFAAGQLSFFHNLCHADAAATGTATALSVFGSNGPGVPGGVPAVFIAATDNIFSVGATSTNRFHVHQWVDGGSGSTLTSNAFVTDALASLGTTAAYLVDPSGGRKVDVAGVNAAAGASTNFFIVGAPFQNPVIAAPTAAGYSLSPAGCAGAKLGVAAGVLSDHFGTVRHPTSPTPGPFECP